MTTPIGDQDATARAGTDVMPSPRPRSREAAEQFAPGTIIAGRYRISGILGSGGMGEVYRADDTKLDQQVALKFLPARLARDPRLLARLHDEVRLGRQIAHPNVCRIYDIVDWESAHFVAMEYVDGEDLSRLLRRIGWLPHDKATDIARGIAAGLMAAHAKGILHRDLKPANVMLDSHGDARIMDFGLALVTGEDDGTISGTPAYMAPELVDGAAASVQSDLYALGLVMYELFTGKRVHNAHTLPERLRDMSSDITTPSSVIRDIDPLIERLILRCLHHDPAQRPRSARDVIHALPGGDPLAAAMAAGETPSPRIVAAAGAEGTLRPAVAWGLLALTIALMGGLLLLTRRDGFLRTTVSRAPLEVQAARAADVLRGLGIPAQEFAVHGLEANPRYTAWIYTHDSSPRRWERLRRGLPAVTFWLREESEPLLDSRIGATPKATREAPPQLLPGSVSAETDSRGRLVSLRAIATDRWKPQALRWESLLAAAGMANAKLAPSEPRMMPPSFADARAAWTGTHPDDGTPIRIEAAASRGVPVFFRILAPWDEVDTRDQVPFGGTSFGLVLIVFSFTAITLGALLAWRNLRQRRGDRAGAIRVGAAVFIATFLSCVLFADHELAIGHELNVLLVAISQGLTSGAALALVYLAMEPYVRRKWPDRLISWARLLSGSWRDPMIGRDVLIGIAGGLGHAALTTGSRLIEEMAKGTPAPPFGGFVELLDGRALGIAWIPTAARQGILIGLSLMIALMIFTILLRRRALAVAALFILYMVMFSFASHAWWMVVGFVLIAALYTLLVARFGLLAICTAHMTFVATRFFPLPDAVTWYTLRALVPLFFVVALAVWAFRTSLGRQSAFALGLDDI
jgi:serine/threonine-protein kinase